jgi:hypothetical protein
LSKAHPINKIIQTPASSTLSLESTSLSQRGTYNVTVHRRRRHASTEFPYANRDLEDNERGLQPIEDSRILGLRSDPSVASLLELYDEHGRLSNDAFANDESLPVQEGHAQVRRSGSTLRQLLGAPSTKSGNDNSEGDISWAERYLAYVAYNQDAGQKLSDFSVRVMLRQLLLPLGLGLRKFPHSMARSQRRKCQSRPICPSPLLTILLSPQWRSRSTTLTALL